MRLRPPPSRTMASTCLPHRQRAASVVNRVGETTAGITHKVVPIPVWSGCDAESLPGGIHLPAGAHCPLSLPIPPGTLPAAQVAHHAHGQPYRTRASAASGSAAAAPLLPSDGSNNYGTWAEGAAPPTIAEQDLRLGLDYRSGRQSMQTACASGKQPRRYVHPAALHACR